MGETLVTAIRHKRRKKDRLAERLMSLLTLGVVLLVPLIGLALFLRARPILAVNSLGELLLSMNWHPLKGAFGFYPFIMGTLWVTAVAMVIAVPPSLLTAIYLAEYAAARTRALVKPFIDLLAGIPSVVYGVWGMLTVVPFVGHVVAPTLNRWLGLLPLFSTDNNPTGYGILAGGLVLAVMVFPIIIAVADDVIRAVPQGLREASLSLGATRWQTIRRVVLRRAWPGVVAAVMLGFSRALGETMAVLMVVGNMPQVPHSIFDAAYPLTALIANNYGEMMSIPLYDAALLGGALILLIIALVFSLLSRLVLVRLVRVE
ncbi:MAG: phosphate ABC transporter permease subunit PstC [Chloroflexi bacterium]|nr:phosphate ABC transporter permease subunit PstC [Chloroflexota bacterium]MBU1661752.1 phosphate ABC transporter permease subunit PstC [Chloroflexota bacterium]